jgi:hypothetical protein
MGKTHDMLYREAINIAELLAAVYNSGTLNVAERTLVDALDDFNARLLRYIEGYEQETAELRATTTRLRQERDDLIDENAEKVLLEVRMTGLQDRLDKSVFDFLASQRSLIRAKSVVEHLISTPY